MFTYEETLDPSEVKDFTQDWSKQLAAGETVNDPPVVSFVDAAGTSQPYAASAAGSLTRVWLTGGTHLGRVIFVVRITTSESRQLENGFAVDVVDNAIATAGETEVEKLTRLITEAKAQRHAAATGNAIVEVWRDGRRIKKAINTLAELNDYIRTLESELATAQVAAGVAPETPRRRAIGLQWA